MEAGHEGSRGLLISLSAGAGTSVSVSGIGLPWCGIRHGLFPSFGVTPEVCAGTRKSARYAGVSLRM